MVPGTRHSTLQTLRELIFNNQSYLQDFQKLHMFILLSFLIPYKLINFQNWIIRINNYLLNNKYQA